MPLSKEQHVRTTVYRQVDCILQQQKFIGKENETDSHLFFSLIEEDGKYNITGNFAGSERSLIQMLMQVVEQPDCPKAIKKAILVVAANVLGDIAPDNFEGRTARDLSRNLGEWVEINMGHIDCDCENCRTLNREARL